MQILGVRNPFHINQKLCFFILCLLTFALMHFWVPYKILFQYYNLFHFMLNSKHISHKCNINVQYEDAFFFEHLQRFFLVNFWQFLYFWPFSSCSNCCLIFFTSGFWSRICHNRFIFGSKIKKRICSRLQKLI